MVWWMCPREGCLGHAYISSGLSALRERVQEACYAALSPWLQDWLQRLWGAPYDRDEVLAA
eukprot:2772320-Amphidinium_carterae.1